MKRGLLLCLLAVLVIGAPISEGIAKERPHTLRQKIQVLSARTVSVNFKDKDLSEIVRFLTEYTGVNIIVSPILTAQADDFDLSVTLRLNEVSVRQLLSIILDLKGLAAVHRHGVIMITTPRDARGKPFLRIYPIGDLTFKVRDFPGPNLMLRPAGSEGLEDMFGGVEEGKERAFADAEFIQDLILENTGKDTWEDDGVRVNVTERYIFVRTYGNVHREITRLLMLLRAYH
jgi:hypothetical protein